MVGVLLLQILVPNFREVLLSTALFQSSWGRVPAIDVDMLGTPEAKVTLLVLVVVSCLTPVEALDEFVDLSLLFPGRVVAHP